MGAGESVEERCHARVGLMGNPSDGFEGKTLSFLLGNFAATVTIEATSDKSFEIVPHPSLDPLSFASPSSSSSLPSPSGIGEFVEHIKVNGYYGGVRLVQAAVYAFVNRAVQCGHASVIHSRGFRIKYNTTIPRCVGLSGSSAIIIAAYRGLMRFYGLSVEALGMRPDEFPTAMLDVERRELGISAGLQDRVIQTYGGLVHMDFTSAGPQGSSLPGGVYTPADPALLPQLYLAYNTKVGGDSGGVHSTVKERWARRDSSLVEGMKKLGGFADEALAALQRGDSHKLAELVSANFAMRRNLYGDDVVGAKNIALAELAQDMGLSAKFTGSGGAFVCIRSDGAGWLEAERELEVRRAFDERGFQFVRIHVPTP